MGLSKSKTKSDPWKPAQPFILKGLQQSGEVFDQQQPSLNKFSSLQMGTYGRLAPGAEQGVAGAQGLVNNTINGGYLNGNPYMQGMIDRTNESVSNRVNSNFSASGRYGSDYHTGELTRGLADAENQMRYANYGQERAYQNDAVGQAQNLMGGSQGLLNNAAELPWIGVGALNGNVRNASNGYGTQTSKEALGPQLLRAASSAANAAIASDIRLKTNIELVGKMPDGLGIYDFDYLPIEGRIAEFMPSGRHRGVMAHEVESLRPDALGPVIDGYATVNYEVL